MVRTSNASGHLLRTAPQLLPQVQQGSLAPFQDSARPWGWWKGVGPTAALALGQLLQPSAYAAPIPVSGFL